MRRSTAAFLAAGLAAACGPAAAQEWIGTFEDWSVFQYVDGARVCYLSSTPLDMEPKNVRRGDVYIQVIHDAHAATRDVVSIIAGYTHAENSTVLAAIGPTEFRMFTEQDSAWNPTPNQDRAMVQAMIAGSRLTVRGSSNRGTETVDIYSLLGFTAAHETIDDACPAG